MYSESEWASGRGCGTVRGDMEVGTSSSGTEEQGKCGMWIRK